MIQSWYNKIGNILCNKHRWNIGFSRLEQVSVCIRVILDDLITCIREIFTLSRRQTKWLLNRCLVILSFITRISPYWVRFWWWFKRDSAVFAFLAFGVRISIKSFHNLDSWLQASRYFYNYLLIIYNILVN